MKAAKPPAETPEQKQQRIRAESDNLRAMQDGLPLAELAPIASRLVTAEPLAA